MYWLLGSHGDSFDGATLHRDRDCPDGSTRPLAESTAEAAAVTFCDDCTARGEDGADDAEPDRENASDEMQPAEIEQLIEAGVCPWCEGDDGYEGEHIGQHASSAHAEEWAAYSDS